MVPTTRPPMFLSSSPVGNSGRFFSVHAVSIARQISRNQSLCSQDTCIFLQVSSSQPGLLVYTTRQRALGYRPGMRVGLVTVGEERQWDAKRRTVYRQTSLSRPVFTVIIDTTLFSSAPQLTFLASSVFFSVLYSYTSLHYERSTPISTFPAGTSPYTLPYHASTSIVSYLPLLVYWFLHYIRQSRSTLQRFPSFSVDFYIFPHITSSRRNAGPHEAGIRFPSSLSCVQAG